MRPVYRPFSRISEFGCREYKHLQCAYEPTIRYINFKSAFFDLADPQTIKNQPDLISQYDFATSNQPFSTSPCHKLTQKDKSEQTMWHCLLGFDLFETIGLLRLHRRNVRLGLWFEFRLVLVLALREVVLLGIPLEAFQLGI